jgi:hypothetical protein
MEENLVPQETDIRFASSSHAPLEAYERDSQLTSPMPEKKSPLDLNDTPSTKESTLSWNDYRWRQNGKKKRKVENGWIIRLYYDCANRTKNGCSAKLKIEKKGATESYQIYGEPHNHSPPSKLPSNRLVKHPLMQKLAGGKLPQEEYLQSPEGSIFSDITHI